MKVIFSREGFTRLRMSWALLVVCIAVSASIGAGGHWYLEREKREGGATNRKLVESRARLENARRERENLIESAEVFRTLVDRGMLKAERRLDLIELLGELKQRHQIALLEYEIAPQRALPLPGGRSFDSVEVMGSRVKFKLGAVHEGDLFAFLDGLSRASRGFYPVDRCTMKRTGDSAPEEIRIRVEADCVLEWISLKEKSRVAASK